MENGFAVGSDGVFVLTNQAAYRYVASPDEGVQHIWRETYDTSGVKSDPDDNLAGGGLSYGSGTTPSLSGELVIFTDNVVPVHLIAVKRDTGEPVCRVPVFLDIIDMFRVAVDQSPMVYDQGNRVSVVITNTYGVYDPETAGFGDFYLTGGNSVLEPGILRVDLVRQDDGTYAPHYIWERTDYSTTALVKFSTGSGYLYAYSQDLAHPDSEEWRFDILHFETGETVLSVPAGSGTAYNNTTGGMMFMAEQHAIGVPTDAGFLLLTDIAGTPDRDGDSDSGCFIGTTARNRSTPVNCFRLANRWIATIAGWFTRP